MFLRTFNGHQKHLLTGIEVERRQEQQEAYLVVSFCFGDGNGLQIIVNFSQLMGSKNTLLLIYRELIEN